MHSIVMRDGLRNEVAKQNAIYAEMKSTVEQQKMDLSKLNMMMNQGEDESSKLRERYSVEEKKRNDRWESLPVYTCVINGHHVALFSVSLFDLKSCQSTIAEYEKSENEIFLWQISKIIYLMIAMFEVFNSWRVAYLYQYCSRFLFHFVLITFLFIQRLEAYPERGGSLHILWKSKHWR